jgi:hypothetical protein|tara:strand:- start:10247 stop:10798 length:552 start_codon:yes stop_codon:yes gene_type:complete
MTPEVIAALEGGHFDIRFLIEFKLDSGTVRYTTEPNGATFGGSDYTYLAAIGGLSAMQETGALDPSDYEIEMSGVDPVLLAVFLNEPIINRQCSVTSVIYLDSELVGELSRIDGIMQPAKITYGRTSVIKLPVRDALADWDRNIKQLYTDETQRRINPLDNCLEHVSEIAGRVIIWPASSYWD